VGKATSAATIGTFDACFFAGQLVNQVGHVGAITNDRTDNTLGTWAEQTIHRHAPPWDRVRTESLPVRKLHPKPHAIRESPPLSRTSCVLAQTRENLASGKARIFSQWRYLDDLPMNQLGFALDFV
jgi:hypothetical protein